MKKITVLHDKNSYPIIIDFGLFQFFDDFLPIRSGDYAMIITNKIVYHYYSKLIKLKLLNKGINVDVLIIHDGEKYKTLKTINFILTELLKKKYSRNSILIGIGGGVIGDLTGFAASCYQRGIAFIQMPTTLLSQVDSSIGGKTGVNHRFGKNMIGSFYQPLSVIIDLNCLYTLPLRHISSGLAEIIKCSIIVDYNFFCWLENNIINILNYDKSTVIYCVFYACKLKAKIVSMDPYEKYDTRVLLNLGHTFGHAIETEYNYDSSWLHGEAIAIGIIMAAKTAELMGIFHKDDTQRIINLIKLAKLPVQGPSKITAQKYLFHILKDKKNKNKEINLVLPQSIGCAKLYTNVNKNIILQAIKNTLSIK
uniref:3-dehydroquinate synthase n=1 Tax=Candidatus Aschnera chinzeii TaxID=1485666 RepID=A0AAT9G5D4_9ENTR|nr:MAG: 3-dehydroquinate synthase [Candidatus Aschnera chinzeii]